MRLLPVMAFPVLIALTLIGKAALADDLKINQLEQDVRDLRQQIVQQERRIDRLEGDLSRSNAINRRPADGTVPREAASADEADRQWLKIANWERVRAGMSELDVLQLLGPPTTLRKSDDGARQTLMYALEIGTGSYLSGTVVMQDKRVAQVNKPALK